MGQRIKSDLQRDLLKIKAVVLKVFLSTALQMSTSRKRLENLNVLLGPFLTGTTT